jgi:hypothetical protein
MATIKNQLKEVVAQYLPKDLLTQLKPMAKAEVQSLMLKYASDNDISVFSARVISFINPKFDEGEFELAEADIYSFAKNCELTAEEFLIALELASERKLSNEKGEIIQLYKQIDRLTLGTVKSAYIELKKTDKNYNDDKLLIKNYLSPENAEKTPEEKQKQRIDFLTEEYRRLIKDGKVLGTVIFYGLMKKSGIETVKLKWLEHTLDRFKPEEPEKLMRSLETESLKLPKIKKNDVKTYLIDNLVYAYFRANKLNEMTEKEFIEYWENIKKNNECN